MKAVCDALAELIRESGLSIRTIAKYANTPESTIRNILHGRTVDPRLSTISDICRACGTSIERLLSAPESAPQGVSSCAPCAKSDAHTPDHEHSADSSPRFFPDEGNDDALIMCHTLPNTGRSFGGDVERLQYQYALKDDADARIRSLQDQLEKAIAARIKKEDADARIQSLHEQLEKAIAARIKLEGGK